MNDSVLHNLDRGVADEKGQKLDLVLLFDHCGGSLGSGLGSRAVTVVAENTPIARSHCIIIDAGHGGEDGGAVSCTGIAESQYNLDISLRLNDLFHFLGNETKMIRTTDTAIYTSAKPFRRKKISDLKERVRIANETEHAIYLSIHQNNFTDSQYSGAQVFYPSEGFSRDLASRLQENFCACLNPESHRTIKKSKVST